MKSELQDKYIKQYLEALNQCKNNEDKATILNRIYSDGFEDGCNEGCNL